MKVTSYEGANQHQNSLQLKRVAFYGRMLSEYVKMFDIDLSLWKDCEILDCPGGASSFVAEANKLGIHVIGCDPLFGNDLKSLVQLGKADIKYVIERVSHVPHLFKWEFYPTIKALKEYRTLALRRFSEDYTNGIIQNRYIKAELPKLPFKDKSFDLVLSGHFLFLYSDKFDYSFHLDSILELFRVSSNEVRIFPIQGQNARPYEHIGTLLSELKNKDITADIIPVSFEFQLGSNQMLRLIR